MLVYNEPCPSGYGSKLSAPIPRGRYPLAFSVLREGWGGYVETLWLCAGVSLGLALLIATCFNRPRK